MAVLTNEHVSDPSRGIRVMDDVMPESRSVDMRAANQES